jgi:hypothetical protein
MDDQMSDVMLDAATMRECKAIPVEDYNRALVCIRRALEVAQARGLNITAENLEEAIEMLTGDE